jgi:hypothetical protein
MGLLLPKAESPFDPENGSHYSPESPAPSGVETISSGASSAVYAALSRLANHANIPGTRRREQYLDSRCLTKNPAKQTNVVETSSPAAIPARGSTQPKIEDEAIAAALLILKKATRGAKSGNSADVVRKHLGK